MICQVINWGPLHYWQLKWGMWSVLHERQLTDLHHLLSTLQVTLRASLPQQFSEQQGNAHSFLERALKISSWTAFPPNLIWVSVFIYTHLKYNVTTPNLPNILWSSLFHLQLAKLFPAYSLGQHWNCILCTTESLHDSCHPQESILGNVLSSLRIPPTSPWNKRNSCRKSPGLPQIHLYQPQYITVHTMSHILSTFKDVLPGFFMLRNSSAELDNNKQKQEDMLAVVISLQSHFQWGRASDWVRK